MSYTRYSSIPSLLRPNVFKEYDIPKTEDTDVRVVDDAQYVPNKKANEILAKNKALGMLTDMSYDDPEDIKSGAVNVYARRKGRDMAELTQQMRSLEKKATEGISQALKDQQAAQANKVAESSQQVSTSSSE